MNILLRVFLLLLPFQAIAQNPELTSLNPMKFQTQSDPTSLHLTINGKNMWPDRLTISMAREVMHVHFKRDGRDVIMPRSTIGSSSYTLSFSSPGWADKPGTIEVYVTIAAYPGYPAYRSNSLYLTIEPTPTAPPVLSSLSNSSFKMGQPKETYQLRIVGKNFGENASTSVTVGGVNAGVGWWNLKDGVMDIWVPSEVYSKAGDYPVVVKTKYGTSNALPLKIEAGVMIIKPITTTTKPIAKTSTVKPMVNPAAKTVKLSVNKDNASRLSAEMLRGVRVTMVGVIRDGSLSAQLESYITALENVFVVDNQLALSDNPGNININLKAVGVDAAAVEQVNKQIKAKADMLNLTVSIAKEP
jgi:hypothetical protein